jgi:hypothetical protein
MALAATGRAGRCRACGAIGGAHGRVGVHIGAAIDLCEAGGSLFSAEAAPSWLLPVSLPAILLYREETVI